MLRFLYCWNIDRNWNTIAARGTIAFLACILLSAGAWSVVGSPTTAQSQETESAAATVAPPLDQLLLDAATYSLNEKHADAEACYRRAMKSFEKTNDAKGELNTAFLLAKSIVAQEAVRPSEAVEILRNALDKHASKLDDKDPTVLAAKQMLKSQIVWYVWITCGDPNAEAAARKQALRYATLNVKMRLDDNNSIALTTLALAQFSNQRTAVALKTMQRAISAGEFKHYPGQFLVMAQIENANGNVQAARDWYVAACRWMFKTNNTFAPLVAYRNLTSELLGLSPSFPPEGYSRIDCLQANERLLASYPGIALLVSFRAVHLAAEHNWQSAIKEYKRAVKLNPDEFRHLEELTALELYHNEDVKARTRACRRLIDAYLDKANIHRKVDIVILCSLADNAMLDRQQLLAAARAAAEENDDDTNIHFRIGTGLAQYRTDDFEDALNVLPAVDWQEGAGNSPYVVLFRAMSEFQLGNKEEAKRLLIRGRQIVDSGFASPQGSFTIWRSRPTDWCMVQMALNEAVQLIEGPGIDPIVRAIAQRQKDATTAKKRLTDLLNEAAVHVLADEFDHAERCYRQALKRIAGKKDPMHEVKVAVLLANAMKQQGPRRKEIADLMDNVLSHVVGKLDPENENVAAATELMREAMNWWVWATCTSAGLDRSRYAEAVRMAKKVRTLSDEDAQNGLWTLAFAQFRHGNLDEAHQTMAQACNVGTGAVWPGQWFIMSLIESALGNSQAASDWHVAGCHWMDKTRNTFAPAMHLRAQSAGATDLSESYPPQEWSEQDCLESVERLAAAYPTIERLLYMRATRRAAAGNWIAARDDYKKTAEMNPDVFRNHEAFAITALYAGGDVDSRTQICQDLIDKWIEDENVSAATDVIVICSLVADAKLDREQLASVAAGTREIATNQYFLRLGDGLALYRCGKHREALEMIPDVGLYASPKDAAISLLFRAMAHERLGESDASRQLLDEARDYVSEHLSSPTGELAQWQDRPLIWCMVQMALKEAEQVVSNDG
jgi:tetratricopeptide (TPR) repeat protein